MANHASTKKRIRKTVRQTEVNGIRKTRIRTFLRKVEEAIAGGEKTTADAAFKAAQPELMRGVAKGIFHKNTASRKLSRLSARIKVLAA